MNNKDEIFIVTSNVTLSPFMNKMRVIKLIISET